MNIKTKKNLRTLPAVRLEGECAISYRYRITEEKRNRRCFFFFFFFRFCGDARRYTVTGRKEFPFIRVVLRFV